MGLEQGLTALRAQFPQVQFEHAPDLAKLAAAIADADVYVGWLNRDIFLAAKQLKWIQSPSSGVNYFLDIPELKNGDLLLTSASGTHAACVADSTLAMILAYTRGLRSSILNQAKHVWDMPGIRANMVELTGSTMGIIGLGQIGRAVAKRAHAFDMRVIAVDMYPNNKPDTVEELWSLDRLDELMAQSDFIVVMVPYTAQTDSMIGAAQIAKMKPTAVLVPMSRGGIVDQDALIEALRAKQIAAALMDVTKPEPLPADNPLWDMDNVMIAPHIAGGTQLEGKYILDIFCENLTRFLENRLPLRNQVNKEAGF
jgi:phosphoglycerate dehydrogenase-like enzyme